MNKRGKYRLSKLKSDKKINESQDEKKLLWIRVQMMKDPKGYIGDDISSLLWIEKRRSLRKWKIPTL
jgi:hypothetical protein